MSNFKLPSFWIAASFFLCCENELDLLPRKWKIFASLLSWKEPLSISSSPRNHTRISFKSRVINFLLFHTTWDFTWQRGKVRYFFYVINFSVKKLEDKSQNIPSLRLSLIDSSPRKEIKKVKIRKSYKEIFRRILHFL